MKIKPNALGKRLFRSASRMWFCGLAGLRERTRVWNNYDCPNDAPRVFFGYDHIPRPDEIAQGGMIKLQDLARFFTNTTQGANILYLVSSAYPPSVIAMVRAAKRSGAKVVVNQNGVAYRAWFGTGWQKFNQHLAGVLQQADHVFYQSSFCRDTANRFAVTCRGSSEVLFNSVDTAVFKPAEADVSLDRPVLLLAGSINQFYRMESALHALALVKKRRGPLTIRIAGHMAWRLRDIEAHADIHNLSAALDLRGDIEIRGRYSQREAVDLMQSSHVLLHTKFNDPCPRLVVESMACGLPVVFSRSGGMFELVGEKAGIGVRAPMDYEKIHPPDPVELADAIELILNNYETFRNEARLRAVAMFDVKPWLQRHREVFESLIQPPCLV